MKDFIYEDATTLTGWIRNGELSSRELLEAQIEHIQYYNKTVNSCVAFNYQEARDKADKEKRPLNKLHGLPITIKDTYKVKGMPCTDGNPIFKSYIPNENALTINKLINAGAIPFAKSNVPFKCADIQSYNKIYGTANNPWNLNLTTGGSSGGSAAALAMGFTALELGSDIGGSIRTPSHFCCVYGHKSTYGMISFNGHIMNREEELSEPDLAVIGPMARSARDLELMLDILVQPDEHDHYYFQLKSCEKNKIQDFKVLFWMDDEACPIDSRMKKKYEELLDVLKKANVKVDIGRPQNWDFDEIYNCYATKLSSQMMIAEPKIHKAPLSLLAPSVKLFSHMVNMPSQLQGYAQGADLSHSQWVMQHEYALSLKQQCLKVFDQYDIILCPPIFTLAFEHNHQEPMVMRKHPVNPT